MDNVELGLKVGGPVGDVAQVLVQTAVEVASQLYKLDAYELAEMDVLPKVCLACQDTHKAKGSS